MRVLPESTNKKKIFSEGGFDLATRMEVRISELSVGKGQLLDFNNVYRKINPAVFKDFISEEQEFSIQNAYNDRVGDDQRVVPENIKNIETKYIDSVALKADSGSDKEKALRVSKHMKELKKQLIAAYSEYVRGPETAKLFVDRFENAVNKVKRDIKGDNEIILS